MRITCFDLDHVIRGNSAFTLAFIGEDAACLATNIFETTRPGIERWHRRGPSSGKSFATWQLRYAAVAINIEDRPTCG